MIATGVPAPARAGMRIEDLKALYLDDVFRFVSAFVRPPQEAEDVTMNVFHAAYQSPWRVLRAQDPRLWLLGIARRKVADSLRSSYRRRESSLKNSIPGDTSDVDQSLIISGVLQSMSAEHSQVLVLKYVNGLSMDEIAAVLNRSTAAVNSLLQRARESFHVLGAPHFMNPEGQI